MTIEQTNDPFAPDTDDLLAVVRESLDGYEYAYQQFSPTALRMAIRGELGAYHFIIGATDTTHYVRVQATYGAYVPGWKRQEVAEAIARINFGLGIGSFDIDFSDGELRFRVGVNVEDGLLSTTMVDNMVGLTIHTMEKFHHALMRVAFGDAEPHEVLAEVA